MYTGKTEQPCCLCGNPEIDTRIDVPPRAIQLLEHGDPIAWQDVVGHVSLYFCAEDWETVVDLVLDAGMSPLPRCNAARADFDLREDFEARFVDVRDVPDQSPLEAEFLEQSATVIEEYDAENGELRALVEARVVQWAMEDLGAAEG